MFWKKVNEIEKNEKKIEQINETVRKSFVNVKRDTTAIFQWMNFFYRKIMEQDGMIRDQDLMIRDQDKMIRDQDKMIRDQNLLIREMKMDISHAPKTREEIRKIVDDHYELEALIRRVKELDHNLEKISRQKANIVPHEPEHKLKREIMDYDAISELQDRLQKLEIKRLSGREKMARKIVQKSKEYVKSVIISYLKKYERISALKLKEIIVDEQNFCSKSSFYRILEELENLDEIGVLRQGKENFYLYKAMKNT